MPILITPVCFEGSACLTFLPHDQSRQNEGTKCVCRRAGSNKDSLSRSFSVRLESRDDESARTPAPALVCVCHCVPGTPQLPRQRNEKQAKVHQSVQRLSQRVHRKSDRRVTCLACCQTHWRSVRCAPAGRHSGASEIPATSAW